MKTTLRLMLVILLSVGAASFAQEQAPAVNHNTWTSGAPIPTAVVSPAGTGVVKGKIYVVGGQDSSGNAIADTQIYDPVANTWTAGVSLPTPTENGSAAVVKNILYLFGGYTGTEYTNAVWAFNPKTHTWTTKSPMPTLRASTGAVATKTGIIYVIGGEMNGNRLNTVESYDPATDTWTEEAPLLVGKSEASVGLVGKTIVAADGYTSSEDTGDNESYNLATNSWTSLKSDPTPRNTVCGGAIGTQMYIAGGYPGGGPGTPALALNESFKASKNTWTTLASLPQATMFPGSAVYKGQLYCIGGWTAFQRTVLNNVQIYQP